MHLFVLQNYFCKAKYIADTICFLFYKSKLDECQYLFIWTLGTLSLYFILTIYVPGYPSKWSNIHFMFLKRLQRNVLRYCIISHWWRGGGGGRNNSVFSCRTDCVTHHYMEQGNSDSDSIFLAFLICFLQTPSHYETTLITKFFSLSSFSFAYLQCISTIRTAESLLFSSSLDHVSQGQN